MSKKHKIRKPKHRSGVAVAARQRRGAGFHDRKGYSRKVKHKAQEAS